MECPVSRHPGLRSQNDINPRARDRPGMRDSDRPCQAGALAAAQRRGPCRCDVPRAANARTRVRPRAARVAEGAGADSATASVVPAPGEPTAWQGRSQGWGCLAPKRAALREDGRPQDGTPGRAARELPPSPPAPGPGPAPIQGGPGGRLRVAHLRP